MNKIINLKSLTDFSGFYVVYKGSTLNENRDNYGISHLMEHLQCKTFSKLYDDFDRFGISWNAYTSNTDIVYHFTGLDQYLYKYRHDLVNLLLKFNISEKEFDTERNVVIQEYRDCFQDQGSSHYYNLMRKEFGNYGPIGKLESLKKLKYSDIKDYFNLFLKEPSMIINISKNNEFKDFDIFSNREKVTYKQTNDNDDPIIEKLAKFDKSSIIGYVDVDSDFSYIQFINKMISGSMKSPLMQEIREKRGLSYGVSTYIDNYANDRGLLTTSLITDDDKVSEVLDVYKKVLSNPKKYLTKDRFDIVKDYFKIKFKKSEINRYSNVDHLILPEKWDLE